MADIKQAAKWLREGKNVRRADRSFVKGDYVYAVGKVGTLIYQFYHPDPLQVTHHDCRFDPEMLLADDWEIAE